MTCVALCNGAPFVWTSWPNDGRRLIIMQPEFPGEPVEVPEDALVIRFRPAAPEDVLRWAEKEHRRIGRHRLSVFADVARGTETEDELRRRLLRASELSINPAKNSKYFVCARAADLRDRGFTFWKDGDDDEEPDEHYSVDLGTDATLEDVVRFLGAFGPGEKRPTG
jgi:hypothetical protein